MALRADKKDEIDKMDKVGKIGLLPEAHLSAAKRHISCKAEKR
jgi:hypothetical protein